MDYRIDEPRAGSPAEEGCYFCSRCREWVPFADAADHSEAHYDDESLAEREPPRDPVVRAFWEGWRVPK